MEPTEPAESAPLSASRLRAAFARMLGKPSGDDAPSRPAGDPDAVTPEGVVEALLFVGRPGGSTITAEEIAAEVRDTTPAEVEAIVERLNETYAQTQSAFRIEGDAGGYRLALADGLERVGDRLRGRVRPAQLTPAALQALAVVAYRQPVDGAVVEELCGTGSAAGLRQLVRLGLVRIDGPETSPGSATEEALTKAAQPPRYATTDRFLRTIGLAAVDQLPRVAELDD